jgi:hypothetical protein
VRTEGSIVVGNGLSTKRQCLKVVVRLSVEVPGIGREYGVPGGGGTLASASHLSGLCAVGAMLRVGGVGCWEKQYS